MEGSAWWERYWGRAYRTSPSSRRYRFRTIRPVPYPGRTPHIHAAVFQEGGRPFVTQIYVAGEPLNQRDGLFMRVPEALLSRTVVLAVRDTFIWSTYGPYRVSSTRKRYSPTVLSG